jgi:hypothetical protein
MLPSLFPLLLLVYASRDLYILSAVFFSQLSRLSVANLSIAPEGQRKLFEGLSFRTVVGTNQIVHASSPKNSGIFACLV